MQSVKYVKSLAVIMSVRWYTSCCGERKEAGETRDLRAAARGPGAVEVSACARTSSLEKPAASRHV